MPVASHSILTDDLLQACRQRAAGYDRDNRFCQEDFDELKAAGYLQMAVPRGIRRTRLHARRGRARDAAAGRVRAGHRVVHQHAQLLGRRRGRSVARRRQVVRMDPSRRGRGGSVRGRACRERQRNVHSHVDHQGRKGAGRLSVHRSKIIRQSLTRVDEAGPARHGHERPGEPEGRPRISDARQRRVHDQGDVGHARHARHPQRRHRPRRRDDSRQVHRAHRAGGLHRRRQVRARHLRLGPHQFRQRLLRAGAARSAS